MMKCGDDGHDMLRRVPPIAIQDAAQHRRGGDLNQPKLLSYVMDCAPARIRGCELTQVRNKQYKVHSKSRGKYPKCLGGDSPCVSDLNRMLGRIDATR